jgi:hypothetical protein
LGGINGGFDETSGFAVLLICDGNESGPQRSNGARAADHEGFPVNPNDVASGRISVACNVWNTATAPGIRGLRDFGTGLPGWQREDVADTSSGRASIWLGIPDSFGRNS